MNTKDIDEIFKIMGREEIDFYEYDYDEELDSIALWELMQEYRYDGLIKFTDSTLKKEGTNNKEDSDSQYFEEYEILYENIMSQIEKDEELYKYFTSKKEENREVYSFLLAFTKSRNEDIEKFLRECIYEGLSEENISNLIKATGNYKKFLFKGQSMLELHDGLTFGNIVRGLENIEDFFMSENVEKCKLEPYDFVDLIIETGNIKKYLTEENIEIKKRKYNSNIKKCG